MAKLPVIKPRQVVKLLEKIGFVIKRQAGSHIRLIHEDGRAVTISIHSKDLPKGTLASILRQAKLQSDEFVRLVKKR